MKSEKNIKIVIGSNYGDEGKGLATDYFASQHPDNGIVVMTNGGSQRAHTVELKDGTRHVFQHFGSGTLRGWNTYYSEYFILNPMQFCKEYDEIKNLYDKPFRIYCSPNCMWSTPYDMIYNQIERALNNRHDTCGMGIWTTIQRYEYCKNNNIQIYRINEFANLSITEKINYLLWIRNYYRNKIIKSINVNNRIFANENKHITGLYMTMFDKGLMEHFLSDVLQMNVIIGGLGFCNPLSTYENIIMENGQGLLLDTDVDVSFGTPSHTGLDTPLEIINKEFADIKDRVNVEVCYVTRTYLTRHGFGYVEDICSSDDINLFMKDETNKYNEFQGSLFFGELYTNSLFKRINNDYVKVVLNNILPQILFSKSLFITHLNEHTINLDDVKKHFFTQLYLSKSKYANDVVVKKI